MIESLIKPVDLGKIRDRLWEKNYSMTFRARSVIFSRM